MHAAVAAFLLCGAAPAATVQAQGGVPTAPRDLAAEPGDTVVKVTWSPPADDGGSDLTGYQIRGGLQTSWLSLPATETGPATFPNLENGRSYTFSVRAVNGIGTGAVEMVEATPRPAAIAPTAPRDLAAASRDTMVTLTWSPPANDGGSAITGYQYQVDQGDWKDAGAADARSVVVTGLENGRSYTFAVRALNERAGPGVVEMVETTPRLGAIAPTAPRDLAAAPGDAGVTLTWSPPADDGGSALTGYHYVESRVMLSSCTRGRSGEPFPRVVATSHFT